MATVYFHGTRRDISRIAQTLAAVLAGRAADTHRIARGFQLVLGFSALSDIKSAFVTKSRGGTDEMGITWEPLKPATIANRRVGPRDLLNAAIKEREKIRKRETDKAFRRLQLSLPEREAKRRAAIVGGLKATKETGRTKLQTLGSRDVEILRDTGVLLNSLSPGTLNGDQYSPPAGEGGKEQIFETPAGQVIVGTNVPYARTHQKGDASRNIPARPFLPDDSHPVPQIWWDRWARNANKALVASAELLYRRAS